MTPHINPRGSSFKGLTNYLLYGHRENMTETPERVKWSATGNMYTDDIEKAAKVMACTAMSAEDLKRANGGFLGGAQSEGKPVYHESLSWRVGDKPSDEHMRETAIDFLKNQGLDKHEYYMIAHNDTEHYHVHIVVNLVDPQTGLTKRLGKDYDAASLWASEYERNSEYGIQSKQREENRELREAVSNDQASYLKTRQTKQEVSEKITAAFQNSDGGQAFKNALEHEGFQLAQSKGRAALLVDEAGEIYAFNRQIKFDDVSLSRKEKNQAIRAKLNGVDLNGLPDAEVIAEQLRAEHENKLEQAKEAERLKENEKQRQEKEEAQEKEALENQEAIEKKQQEKEKSNDQEKNQKTTQEIAEDYIQLAHDPLQDLRGWMDETGDRKARSGGLFAGQERSARDNALLPLRGKEDGRTREEIKAQAEAVKISEKLDKLNIPKYVRLKEAKTEWAEIKDRQSKEVIKLEERLKKQDSNEQIAHREKWQKIIDNERSEQRQIHAILQEKGFRAFLNRLRHGEELKAEHKARGKNIDNARMRLADGVNHLTDDDKPRLAELDMKHKQQREELKKHIDQDLHDIEDSRKVKEEKILQEAASSPERAAALKHAINTDKAQGKEQVSRIEEIEREHKADQELHKNTEQAKNDIARLDEIERVQSNEPEQQTPSPVPLEQEQSGWQKYAEDQEQNEWNKYAEDQERGGLFGRHEHDRANKLFGHDESQDQEQDNGQDL